MGMSHRVHTDTHWVDRGHFYVAVKDVNGNYTHQEVHPDVYMYIRQLEAAVRYPGESRIKTMYEDRFK